MVHRTATAPAPTGLRALAARRPLTVFLVLTFGIGWPVMAVPVLAYHGVIPGGELPMQFFALGVTLLVMLPAALWVTAASEGRAGVRTLLGRAFRWRFGVLWWAVVLLALPVTTLLLGVLFGGSLRTTDVGSVLVGQLVATVIAVLVINLWEETVWAGFLQTRLERRHNLVVAALLTALPFAAIHIPLQLTGDISVGSVLLGVGGLLVLGTVIRLLIGVVLRAAADSVLAVGILHAVFNTSNNQDGLVDGLLDGANQNLLATPAAALLTAALAVGVRRRLGRAYRANENHDAAFPSERASRADAASAPEPAPGSALASPSEQAPVPPAGQP